MCFPGQTRVIHVYRIPTAISLVMFKTKGWLSDKKNDKSSFVWLGKDQNPPIGSVQWCPWCIQHLIVGSLPSSICKKLLLRRKYIHTIHEVATR